MDKESLYELQKIDCNCNNCKFMIRDLKLKSKWDNTELHKDQKNASHRIHYGFCQTFNKSVTFLPNICQIDTQKCFKHRNDD